METKKEEVIILLNSKRIAEAKELLEEMIIGSPEDTFVLYNLGMCYSELGNYQASIETLEKCIEYDPVNSNAYVALGFSYMKASREKDAEEPFLKALEIDPKNIYALQNLGSLYAMEKNYVSAVNTFRKAELINPNYPNIIYGLALAYKEVGDIKKADMYFRKLIARDNEDQFMELAKNQMREIAEAEFKKSGIRFDAVMYCLSAMQKFKNMQKKELTETLAEIALKGERGFDVHNPAQKYELASLPGKYSGLNLVCYLYVGFQIIEPTKDVGFDLSREYKAAKEMLENEQNE